MAEKILNTRILLKYDTLENWNKSTGILRAGEVAIATVPVGSTGEQVGSVATPQVLVKVGDGKNTFANLPYITAKAGDVYAWAKAEKLGVDAFGTDVQKLFTDIENDITALEGKVGDSKVGDQISAAITAALKKLANGDAAVEKQFVTAAVQGEDGKVVVSRRALEAADIPELAQEKITGLTTRLGNIETAIEDINDAEDGILAQAKGYADEKVKGLADGRVAAAEAKLETLTGADTVEGSVAKALKDAKAYADTQVGNAKTELKAYAEDEADDALEAAKDYVDEAIAVITGGETGSLKALEGRVKANEDAIAVINGADTVEGSLAKVAKDAADAVAAEKKRAEDAELALDGRLDTVEAFFEAAEIGGEKVIDTLKEIQEYIEADETGAAGMLASIKANTDAIGTMPVGEDGKVNTTLVEMIAAVESAASQAVADEKLRAEGKEAENAAAAAEADRKAVAAQGEIDALEKVVGTPTAGKTIVEMIAEAKTEATYDDTEVRGLIEDNAEAIANEKLRAEGAEGAIKAEIGVDAQGNYVALEGGHTTLIAAINAANAGVAANAGEIQKNAQAITAINNAETGILKQAKDYTDAEIVKVNNAITTLNGEVIKTVEGDDVIKASIANNKLTIDFDDTLTFVFNCGTSADLDPAQA